MPNEAAKSPASSYRYLRIAIVGLLLALALAVIIQSVEQGSLLASVSAYYYTAAQAVFVGALVGLGVAMIALQGVDVPEDTFLNLGGIFAILVAMLPTGRGADFETLVRACHKSGATLLTGRASANPACPSALALETAARANVNNNVWTLLIVGGVVFLVAGVILLKVGTPDPGWVWAGYSVAALLWLGVLIARLVSLDWLAGNGHPIAASGLGICILAVAAVNARRIRQSRQAVTATGAGRGPSLPGARDFLRTHQYTGIAIALLAVAGVVIPLWLTNVISLFWVEISVAFLFVVFWVVQTLELQRQGLDGSVVSAAAGQAPPRAAPGAPTTPAP